MPGAGLSRIWIFAAALSWTAALVLFAATAFAQNGAVQNAQNRYVHEGVAGCAGSSCHGRLAPSGAVVRQNEIFTWQNEASPSGEHSRAWHVLGQPRGQAIADRLGVGPAQQAPECLGCHADPVPPALRGPKFQISDGVGCESCHGGSRQWVAAHYVVGATHAGNIARGLTALDDPAVRAEVCLDCHYGSDQPGQFVTHELMAAGHPRISFELDLFTTLQAHHTIDADYTDRNKRAPAPIQVWAVGQAKALDRALSLYSTGLGQDGVFPELYFFDCHACHRRIFDERDARPQALANPGRPTPVGTPVFNDENVIMLSASASYASPELAQRLEADSRAFHAALTQDRAAAVAAAAQLRATAQDLAAAFSARRFSREDTFEILDSVLEGALTRYTDYAGSAQAVMAADTLLNSMVASGQVSAGAARAIRPDLDQAYAEVLNPNTYSPTAFRAEFQDVADAVRRLR